jgi:3-deoxy-D-manno-octulosonic-acid transferase
MESEIWPNFLLNLRRRGCPAFAFNAKMSDRSFRGYGKAAFLLRPAAKAIRLFCAQTPADAERMGIVWGRPEDAFVAGNVKLDSLKGPLDPARRAALQAEWGLPPGEPAIVFGSTHAGEEALALDAFLELRAKVVPGLRVIVCPRHPERFEAAWRLCRERLGEGFRLGRASDPATLAQGPVDFLLLDRMGVLGEAYGLGALAVMGGSFAPIGGHNLMEPAARGTPVLCGPHMKAQRELVRLMDEAGAFAQVRPEELNAALGRLLRDAQEREALAAKGLAAAASHKGAARRGFDELERRGFLAGISKKAA